MTANPGDLVGPDGAPLLFSVLAGAVGFYESPKRQTLFSRFWSRFRRRPQAVRPADRAVDGVGAAVGGALGRIVMMQVAIILGGMLARKFGSTAPWLILIGLKTLADFQRPAPTTALRSGAGGQNRIA